MNPTSYPLCWPEGVRRTAYPKRSRFRVRSKAISRDEIYSALKKLGATHVVLSTNLPVKGDGDFYASATAGGRGDAVALYFRRRGKAMVIACDNYDRVEDNLRAVAKTLEALWTIERHGSAQLGDQAFSAFAALPPAGEAGPRMRSWREVLGVPEGIAREDQLDLAETRYRKYTKATHSDKPGGDDFKMAELNGAIARAREELK